MRSLPDTCAPATRKLCNRTRLATGRYWNGFQRDVGVNRATWVVRRCFCVQQRATTLTVMCCWLMVVGWEDDVFDQLKIFGSRVSTRSVVASLARRFNAGMRGA